MIDLYTYRVRIGVFNPSGSQKSLNFRKDSCTEGPSFTKSTQFLSFDNISGRVFINTIIGSGEKCSPLLLLLSYCCSIFLLTLISTQQSLGGPAQGILSLQSRPFFMSETGLSFLSIFYIKTAYYYLIASLLLSPSARRLSFKFKKSLSLSRGIAFISVRVSISPCSLI